MGFEVDVADKGPPAIELSDRWDDGYDTLHGVLEV